MPKVVLGSEGGYSDAPHVRLAERTIDGKLVVTQKVLAIEHPLLGWLKPWAYKAAVAIQEFISRVDPVKGIALIGLTVTYKGLIETAEDVGLWFHELMKNLGFTIPGIPGVTPQVDVPGAVLFSLGPIGWIIGWLLKQSDIEGPSAEEIAAELDKWKPEIMQWFTAFTAAAVTIVIGPSLIGALSPL